MNQDITKYEQPTSYYHYIFTLIFKIHNQNSEGNEIMKYKINMYHVHIIRGPQALTVT